MLDKIEFLILCRVAVSAEQLNMLGGNHENGVLEKSMTITYASLTNEIIDAVFDGVYLVKDSFDVSYYKRNNLEIISVSLESGDAADFNFLNLHKLLSRIDTNSFKHSHIYPKYDAGLDGDHVNMCDPVALRYPSVESNGFNANRRGYSNTPFGKGFGNRFEDVNITPPQHPSQPTFIPPAYAADGRPMANEPYPRYSSTLNANRNSIYPDVDLKMASAYVNIVELDRNNPSDLQHIEYAKNLLNGNIIYKDVCYINEDIEAVFAKPGRNMYYFIIPDNHRTYIINTYADNITDELVCDAFRKYVLGNDVSSNDINNDDKEQHNLYKTTLDFKIIDKESFTEAFEANLDVLSVKLDTYQVKLNEDTYMFYIFKDGNVVFFSDNCENKYFTKIDVMTYVTLDNKTLKHIADFVLSEFNKVDADELPVVGICLDIKTNDTNAEDVLMRLDIEEDKHGDQAPSPVEDTSLSTEDSDDDNCIKINKIDFSFTSGMVGRYGSEADDVFNNTIEIDDIVYDTYAFTNDAVIITDTMECNAFLIRGLKCHPFGSTPNMTENDVSKKIYDVINDLIHERDTDEYKKVEVDIQGQAGNNGGIVSYSLVVVNEGVYANK